MHSNFTSLGGKIYDLASKGAKNPLLDAKVISAWIDYRVRRTKE